jgi:hypothetical protein
MKIHHHNRWQFIGGLVFVLAAAVLTPAGAKSAPKADHEGRYAKLTAIWWEWVYAQPAIDVAGTNTNPVLDSTGAFADLGQEDGIGPGDKYFFLAGTFGGEVERHVTVPEGKRLFFPVINYEADNALDPPTHDKLPRLKELANANIDATILSSLYAKLNGRDLDIFRTQSPPFDYSVPEEDGIFDYFGLFGPQFEGRIKPAVSDGYWSVIPALPAGEYVLEFGGEKTDGFSVAVTYFLTVK